MMTGIRERGGILAWIHLRLLDLLLLGRNEVGADVVSDALLIRFYGLL